MSDEDIVKDFLVESYENLDRLDQELIALEKDAGNRDILGSVFRTIHTIKGTSGFLAFNRLEAVTHAGESLLARLRDGLLTLTPEITTALLTMVDAVRQMLANIESGGNEGGRDDKELIGTLSRLLQSKPEAIPASHSALATDEKEHAPKANATVPPVPTVTTGIPGSRDALRISEVSEAIEQPADDQRHSSEILADKEIAPPRDDAQNPQQQQHGQSASDSTIRVDVSLLDQLMNQVGELVLARNQILQASNAHEESGLQATSQRLNLITTELQEGVMKTRMQPIGNIWGKFPRMVRDLALACGRRVEMEMEGTETELDKTIIEAIKDPLTHLVRNAVDHGIETPAARLAAGKSAVGRILLRAFHEGGQVNIEITDDGAGLNYERIREKAVQRGLTTADQAARMNEHEINSLVFLPGFSTADKVTNVSGRGVGMDVVKTNIEKIGGIVDMQSQPGQGTTVRMKIPLTLAIIPALVVTVAGDRFAIPQVSLLELVRLEGEHARKGIETVHGAPVHRLRGKLLPLIYLNRELKLGTETHTRPTETPNTAGGEMDSFLAHDKIHNLQGVNIVVLQADDQQFGLVVDEINDTEEIVVKPLSKQLKIINTFAGATIMGDGRVALILDVLGLGQRAKVVGEAHNHAVAQEEKRVEVDKSTNRKTMLLFQYGEKGRMAIDLSMVARLEEFAKDSIEIADGNEAVQYRGQIMPLVRISEILGSPQAAKELGTSVQVVVYVDGERSIGLVVDRILDIVEEAFVTEPQTGRKGVLGSAVIQKRITDVLDIHGLISASQRGALAKSAHA